MFTGEDTGLDSSVRGLLFSQWFHHNKNMLEPDEEGLTVKLLLTFLVLDSATLASVRSTSSKMIDCGETHKLRTDDTNTFLTVDPTHSMMSQRYLHTVLIYDRSEVSVSHLSSLSVIQSPPSQFEVSSLPALERVGLFHQVSLLQHSLTHTHTHTQWTIR